MLRLFKVVYTAVIGEMASEVDVKLDITWNDKNNVKELSTSVDGH